MKKLEETLKSIENDFLDEEKDVNISKKALAILEKRKPSLKDDIHTMEHPFFTLSTKLDLKMRKYTHNGNTVEIKPNIDGMPKVFDKDILIYCYRSIQEKINRSEKPLRKIRVIARELLKFINRGVSGREYIKLKEALDRLSGVRVKTTIETNKTRITEAFGLIDSYRVVEKSELDDRMIAIDISLSKWLFNSFLGGEILTISDEYFKIRKPLERRLYELARKHCGRQHKWDIGLELLHKKTGSTSELKLFRYKIIQIEKEQNIPDYYVTYLSSKDKVLFYPKEKFREFIKKHAPRPHIKPKTYENISKMFQENRHKADVYTYYEEWIVWMIGKEPPKNPDGAFHNFCKSKMN